MIKYKGKFAPVAQWIRASVFGTEGRGFESLRVYQIYLFVARNGNPFRPGIPRKNMPLRAIFLFITPQNYLLSLIILFLNTIIDNNIIAIK